MDRASKHSRITSTSSSSTSNSAKGRLSQYRHATTGVSDTERNETIPALALRAYHLPGNSWCEDWFQFIANNHPLFGICCHHRLHPITSKWRIINLFGSIFFGLAVTNLIWLWFISNDDHDADNTILTISVGGFGGGNSTASEATGGNSTAVFSDGEIEVTEGMLILWTIGGGLHAIFDNTVWYITACVCCLPGQKLECLFKYKWCGTYLVILAVVVSTAVASFVVVFRASLEDDQDLVISDLKSAGLFDDQVDFGGGIDDADKWEFLISYSVELALALLVYYPLVGTIFFSGMLGCGRIPILGGRPYEMAQERRRDAKAARRRGEVDHDDSSVY